MDKKLQDYLDCKKQLKEYYMKAIKKVQKIETTIKMEEYIKSQFINQLVRYQCFIRVEFYKIYEKFVEEIERKLRKFIYIDDCEDDEDIMIKFYRLKFLEGIGHYYDRFTCACNPLDSI
jgi:hypothetical protein